MYRQLLKSFLTHSEQLKKNTEAPENKKYCNFLCQDFISTELFYDGRSNCCIKCTNHLCMGKKFIKEGRITQEQFKENPNIVYDKTEEPEIDRTIMCVVCKIEQSVSKFDHDRNTCKLCRKDQAIARTQKDLEKDIEEIEKLKDNISSLTFFIRRIPVNKIQQILKHYEISRKKTDKKEDCIAKLIIHFQNLQNPHRCLGNCGFDLLDQFSYCDACKKKGTKTTIEERNLAFKENLPQFMETLYEILPEDLYDTNTYNLFRLSAIGEFLNIKINTNYTKQEVVNLINEALKSKREEKGKIIIREPKKELVFENFTIVRRESDGFINATQMCKVKGKLFADWYRLECTKEYISIVEEELRNENTDMGAPISVIDIKKGGNGKDKQGSWIHPDLAVNLAEWIDKKFAFKVSRFVQELAITGKVTLQLKTANQLLEMQNVEIKSLQNKHQKYLEKKQYHKFKKGPSFYIISDADSKSITCKPGIDTKNINVRLASHRSSKPSIILEYLVYTDECKLIEDNILLRYKNKRKYVNHEWVYEVDKNHVITSVKTILEFLNIEHTIETNLESYNKQILNDLENDDEIVDEES